MSVKSSSTINGFSVTSRKFQGVSTLNQLRQYGLERPSMLEKRTTKELASDGAAISDSKALRDRVQRRFGKPRLDRAERYSSYIEQTEGEALAMGGSPAVTLFASTPFDTGEGMGYASDGWCDLQVPYGTTLVAIDGETQTEARFILAERLPESAEWPVAITVYHGVSEDFARQILHDYNRYAHPVAERETSSFNKRGPITSAAMLAFDKSGHDKAAMNPRGERATKVYALSWDQVFQLAAGAYQPEQTMRGRVGSKYLSAVNAELNAEMTVPTIDALSSVIADVSNGSAVAGKLAPVVWQVAGAIVSADPSKTRLNWDSAAVFYDRSMKRGALPKAERMSKVEQLSGLRAALIS